MKSIKSSLVRPSDAERSARPRRAPAQQVSDQPAAPVASPPSRSGSQILVRQLEVHGVEHVFCVPGESFLGVLDALNDGRIALTVCRQEGGAAMMAEAVGKSTGRPGVAFVTRGPGAANALPGVYIADHDSTPMVLFVGQVERALIGRRAFQEIDIAAVFGGVAKWATQIDAADRIPEVVARAFLLAVSGRPGPVVIGLPTDMLDEQTSVEDAAAARAAESSPGGGDMERLEAMVAHARAPLVVVGGARWDAASRAAMHAFAERFDVPVATSYRRASLFDPLHRCYAGDLGLGVNPKLFARAEAADVVVVAGARLSEIATQGYRLFRPSDRGCQLVQAHPDAGELSGFFAPDLAIHATPVGLAAALGELLRSA